MVESGRLVPVRQDARAARPQEHHDSLALAKQASSDGPRTRGPTTLRPYLGRVPGRRPRTRQRCRRRGAAGPDAPGDLSGAPDARHPGAVCQSGGEASQAGNTSERSPRSAERCAGSTQVRTLSNRFRTASTGATRAESAAHSSPGRTGRASRPDSGQTRPPSPGAWRSARRSSGAARRDGRPGASRAWRWLPE